MIATALLRNRYERVTGVLQQRRRMAAAGKQKGAAMKPILRATLATLGCLVAVSAAGASGGANTDPSFAPGPSLPAGTTPGAVAVGDFDANGSPDLAIADYGYEQNLRILLNDGSGRFRLAPGSPLDVESGSLATADFNHDGIADLAVAGGLKLKILLGDGIGGFNPAPGSPIALEGGPVSAGDVNRDGTPDLVLAIAEQSGKHTFRVLLNDGTGRFTVVGASPPVTIKGDFFSFAVADLSGDGNLDLAAADSKSKKLAVLLGDGTGAFGAATRFQSGEIFGKLVVGDFNGDGKPDLAEPVRFGSKIAVLRGMGAGRFGSPLLINAEEAYNLAAADFDQDGKSDLAAPSDGGVAVYLGTGTGKLREAKHSPFDGGWINLVATADFDGDSKADILSLAGTGVWWPAQRWNLILFQTHSGPVVEQGRSLPARVDAVFSTRKPIESLAADGHQAAACLNTYRHKGFVVWTVPGKKSLSIPASCYDDITLERGRIAWVVEYALPNEPELKLLVYEERLSDRHRGVIGGVENESNHNDLRGPWLGQLMGSGSLLAWNTWYLDCLSPPPPLCEGDYCEECDSDNPTLRIFGQELAVVHGRSIRAHRGSALYPLRAVGGGRLAATPEGAVVVLAPNGSRVATVPAVETDPPREVALSRTTLAVERTGTLDFYNPATGAELKSIALGPAAALKLVGASSKVALLRGPHELVLVRLADGKVVSMPLPAAAERGLVDAKLTSAGLFYAYDLPRGAKRGRIVFEPASKLLARF